MSKRPRCLLGAMPVLWALGLTSVREARADDNPFWRNPATKAGSAMLVGGYVLPHFGLAPARYPNFSALMLLPLAGPWLTLEVRRTVPQPLDETARAFLIVDGALQASGLGLLILGNLLDPGDEEPPGASRAGAIAIVAHGSGIGVAGTLP